MCLVSDDRIVGVDRENNSIKLVDVTAGRMLHRLQLQDKPWHVCLMPGDRVAVTFPSAERIKVSFFPFILNL